MKRDLVVIAIDGTESAEGRALLAASFLPFTLEWADQVQFRFIDVSDENVLLAIEALNWDHDLVVETRRPDPDETRNTALDGVDLYVGVSFSSARHMRLTEAQHRGIPVILALQFPEPEWLSPSVVLAQEASFDPQILAQRIEQVARPWFEPYLQSDQQTFSYQ